jgi:hypothetical protein
VEYWTHAFGTTIFDHFQLLRIISLQNRNLVIVVDSDDAVLNGFSKILRKSKLIPRQIIGVRRHGRPFRAYGAG